MPESNELSDVLIYDYTEGSRRGAVIKARRGWLQPHGTYVDLILENISRALCDGDKVELRGFGSFKVKERRSRKARNPRTGEAVEVPAKLVPYFKASNELKEQVDAEISSTDPVSGGDVAASTPPASESQSGGQF